MKVFFRVFLVHVVFVFFLSVCPGFAADKKEYPATPPAKISKKWRVAYLEGGPYESYLKVFTATIEGLSELGWMEKISGRIPIFPVILPKVRYGSLPFVSDNSSVRLYSRSAA